ncbi:hypothetical protein FXO37_18005 [Capsicum annuum]|nr:hypothetical protein FXO37_18005 [Capsicum annuum]
MDPQPSVEIFQPPNDTQEGCIDVANITKQESVPKSTYNIAKSNNKIAISKWDVQKNVLSSMPNCLGGQCEHIYAYTGETLNLNSTNSQMLKELHNVKNGKVTVVSKEVDDIELAKLRAQEAMKTTWIPINPRKITTKQGYPAISFNLTDYKNEFDVLLLTPTFKPAEETPLVPIWVVLPKLPWHYYCLEILEPLLSPIGEVLFLDLATYMKNRGSVAKIKIQIDLTQKRPQHVWMGYDEDENMEERRQSVQDKEVLDYSIVVTEGEVGGKEKNTNLPVRVSREGGLAEPSDEGDNQMDEYGFRLTKDQRKDMAQIIGSDSEKNWNHDKDPAIDGVQSATDSKKKCILNNGPSSPLKNMDPKRRNQPAPQPEDPLGEHVSNAEFRVTFTTLAQSVAAQNKRPPTILANPMANSTAARIRDFTRINTPSFHGSKFDEDSQEFIDQSVELSTYQLQDVAHTRYKQWKSGRIDGIGPIGWKEFDTAFLDRFFPQELREAKVLEFINLRQGNMTVREYSLRFTQLARYAPHVIADNRAKMSKFVSGVNDSVVNEYRSAMLNSDITLAKLMTHAQQIEKQKVRTREKQNKRAKSGSFSFAQSKSEERNRSQFCPKSVAPAPSSASVPVPKFRDGSRDKAPGSKSQGSVSSARTNLLCQACGHRIRECPQSGLQGQQIHSAALFGRPNQQGATSSATSGQRPNRLYALYTRQDQENSLDVVTGDFRISPKILAELFSVSTPVGKTIIARWVYRNFPIMIFQKSTSADLVELEMTDFDVILGMDWLHSCYATVDCRNRIVQF